MLQYSTFDYFIVQKKYATIHYNTFNSTQYNKYITGIIRKYNTVKFSVLQPYSPVEYNYTNSIFRLYSAVRSSTV